MIAVKLQNAIDIANLPDALRRGVIDAAYDDAFAAGDSAPAMALEAAVKLVGPVAKGSGHPVRHDPYRLRVSTWEVVEATIIGKFIFVGG